MILFLTKEKNELVKLSQARLEVDKNVEKSDMQRASDSEARKEGSKVVQYLIVALSSCVA